MTIKEATNRNDFQTIENLAREIIPEFYAAITPHDHNLFFVAQFQTVNAIEQQIQNGFAYYLLEEGELVVGYCGLQIDNEQQTMLLSKLYLLKAHRGKGYGTQAMDFIIERATQLGCTTITLTVNRQNAATIRLYERYGFVITKELVNTFENGHTILDYEMRKEIKPS